MMSTTTNTPPDLRAALAQQPADHSNRVSVDGGALQLALSVLRRAGKTEVADALEQSGGERGAVQQPAQPRQPLTERQLAACLMEAGCIGTVKLSFESGPYDIDRPSNNAGRLCRAIERAHGIGAAAPDGGQKKDCEATKKS